MSPIWDDALAPLVSLAPHPGDAAAEFDFWRLGGRKSLLYDGERLLLTADSVGESVRMHVGEGLCHSMPYAYVMAAGASAVDYQRALDPVLRWMARRDPLNYGRAYVRPSLSSIVHMRALQAHDGVTVGASQREIAEVLFGRDVVQERWNPDSELRAHVRYLVGRARSLVNLGYVGLFAGKRQEKGDIAPTGKAP